MNSRGQFLSKLHKLLPNYVLAQIPSDKSFFSLLAQFKANIQLAKVGSSFLARDKMIKSTSFGIITPRAVFKNSIIVHHRTKQRVDAVLETRLYCHHL